MDKDFQKKYINFHWKRYIKYSYVVRNKWDCFKQIWDELWCLNNNVIDEDIIYFIDYKHKNEFLIIPKDFEFDFWSVPVLFRFISLKTRFVMYMIHDRLYDQDCNLFVLNIDNLSEKFKQITKWETSFWYTYEVWDDFENFIYNQKFADKLLYFWIKEENKEIYRVQHPIQEYLIYLAVRIGWGRNFHKT